MSGRLNRWFSGSLSFARVIFVANIVIGLLLIFLSMQDPEVRGEAMSGLVFKLPTAEVSIRFGALYGDHVRQGQWWRVITCLFIHQGLVHLLLNMYMLFMLGPLTEALFGRARFLFIYFGAGLVASIASLFGHDFRIFSLGASGAIMGLVGALAVFGWHQRNEAGQALFRQMAIYGVLVLLLGNFMLRVDNWAHGGGLFGGAVVAWLLTVRSRSVPRETPRERLAAVGVLAVVLTCLGMGGVNLAGAGRSLGVEAPEFQAAWQIYREHHLRRIERDLEHWDDMTRAKVAEELSELKIIIRNYVGDEPAAPLRRILEEQTGLHEMLRRDSDDSAILARTRQLFLLMQTNPWGPESDD